MISTCQVLSQDGQNGDEAPWESFASGRLHQWLWTCRPIHFHLSTVDRRVALSSTLFTHTHSLRMEKTNQTHGRSQKFTKKNSLHTRSSVNTWTHEHALTPMMMNEKVERVRISSPTIFFSSFLGFPLRRNDRPTFYFSLSLFSFLVLLYTVFFFSFSHLYNFPPFFFCFSSGVKKEWIGWIGRSFVWNLFISINVCTITWAQGADEWTGSTDVQLGSLRNSPRVANETPAAANSSG